MPRPDLTTERTAQILDAFERCVARHGLEGTSLEQVADEAGVKRSIIRHYVGNREDLVLAMARRFADRYQDQLNEMRSYAQSSPRVERLLECLFPSTSTDHFSDVVLAEALIAASERDDEIRTIMAKTITDTVNAVRDILTLECPDSPAKAAWTVASGVVGISFNHQSLATLALPPRHRSAALTSARRLIETLRDH